MKKRSSAQPIVVLTDPLLPDVVARELEPHAIVKRAASRAQLLHLCGSADALITLLSDSVDRELLACAPKLRAVGNVAVGYNNIDLPACRARGIRVVNTPDVLNRATAELTLALLLAVARRIPEGEDLCRRAIFKGWTPRMLLGQQLRGRRAVLVGAGRIGRETGALLRALGIRVEFITHSDSSREIRAKLRRAQILSLHVPLNSDTRHWLNKARLELLAREAIVINTSRGPVVDEQALIRSLRARRIFGAGLDVFEREPEIPIELRRLKNVVLLPHLGSATREAREGMVRLAIRGVLGILSGKRVPNEVK